MKKQALKPRGKCTLIFFIRDDGFFNMQSAAAASAAGVVMAVAGRASGLAEGKNGADSEKYGIDF